MQTQSDFNPNLHLQPIRAPPAGRLQTASYCPSVKEVSGPQLLHECHYHCADNKLQSRRTGLPYLTVWLARQQGVFCSDFFKVITAQSRYWVGVCRINKSSVDKHISLSHSGEIVCVQRGMAAEDTRRCAPFFLTMVKGSNRHCFQGLFQCIRHISRGPELRTDVI